MNNFHLFDIFFGHCYQVDNENRMIKKRKLSAKKSNVYVFFNRLQLELDRIEGEGNIGALACNGLLRCIVSIDTGKTFEKGIRKKEKGIYLITSEL